MLHKSMHSTDSALPAAWDGYWGNNNFASNHKAIFNRVAYAILFEHEIMPDGSM